MTSTKMNTLLELIDELVGEGGAWSEKRDDLLATANDHDIMNLMEFVEWFEDADID